MNEYFQVCLQHTITLSKKNNYQFAKGKMEEHVLMGENINLVIIDESNVHTKVKPQQN